MKRLTILFALCALPASAQDNCQIMTKAEFLQFQQQQKSRMEESCGLFFCNPASPSCPKSISVCWTDTDEGNVIRRDLTCKGNPQ
ncbi:MAG TPA: hypothetical protein VHW09_26765 [Bryobacteraceae bacterium]|jgi:hypothetical protein|nr:hypothetical protein [Bryobacteraceae bacterium]